MNNEEVDKQKNIVNLLKKQTDFQTDLSQTESIKWKLSKNDEWNRIIDLISDISFTIVLLSANGVTDKEIDRCLEKNYKLYGLVDILDFMLAVSVNVLFRVESDFDNFKYISETLLKIVGMSIDEIAKELASKNENAKEDSFQKDNSCAYYEIDTNGLEIGMVVKNYKELCYVLKQSPTTGKAKQLQLKEFQRYFEWEKSGQKFIITDIYDMPLEKDDRRKKGNNSIYVKYIELILLQFLSKQKDGMRTFKKRDWWQLLGMVNYKYNKISQKNLREIDNIITSFEIKHFYQRCNKKLEQVLFSALNNLQNRKLITYELQTVIVDNNNEYFCANDSDKRCILQEERYVLHKIMGFEKLIQVFCRFKQDEYYRMVNQRLSELYNWHHYFKQIKIIYIQKDILDAIPQIEIDLQKEILNQKMVEVLNKEAQKKYEQEKDKWEKLCKNLLWGEYEDFNFKFEKGWKIPDTYLDAQEILVNELICIGHNNSFLPLNFEEDDEMNQIFNSFLR